MLLIGAGTAIGALLVNNPGTTPARTTTQNFSPPPSPPPSAPPSTIPSGAPPGPPAINMMQPFGDVNTEFIVHGAGWRPASHVTVELTGPGIARVSPVHPAVDAQGTFNYLINQDHEFMAGSLPPGFYHVIVTGPGGHRVRVRFQVIPMPGRAPPGGAPPGGSASGGSASSGP